MTWLYVSLLAVVCAAVPATVWLKRAGDQAWRERRQRELLSPIGEALLRFQIGVAVGMTPALREMSRAAAEMQASLTRAMADNLGLREFSRTVDQMNRKGRGL